MAGGELTADSLIVATGARARWLGLPEELEFRPGMLEFLETSSIVPGSPGTSPTATSTPRARRDMSDSALCRCRGVPMA